MDDSKLSPDTIRACIRELQRLLRLTRTPEEKDRQRLQRKDRAARRRKAARRAARKAAKQSNGDS
jgi:hypothetical protein